MKQKSQPMTTTDANELKLGDDLLFDVKVKYTARSRYRGVLVKVQAKDTWQLPAKDETEVKRVARKYASSMFASGLSQLQGSISNLQTGEILMIPNTLKVLGISKSKPRRHARKNKESIQH
jgi:hypothetical protein